MDPGPRAIPLTGLRVVVDDEVVEDPLVAVEAVVRELALVPEYETLGVLPRPVLRTTLPRVVPRVVRVAVACARFLCSSSAFRAAASR